MRAMVPLLLLLLPTLAGGANVRVRVAALPDAETCRSDRALATQLQAVNGVSVADRDFDFDATLERNGADWQISLRKPDGTLALKRSLVGAKACADVSFAAALIIERFARTLDVRLELPGVKLRTDDVAEEAKAARARDAAEERAAAAAKKEEKRAAAAKAAEVRAAEKIALAARAAEKQAATRAAAERRITEAKISGSKAAAAVGGGSRVADSKSAEIKSTDTKAVESRAAVAKAADSRTSEARGTDAKDANARAADGKDADAKDADGKPADGKPADAKPARSRSAETNADQSRAAESKAAESKAAESKAAGANADELRLAAAAARDAELGDARGATGPEASSSPMITRWEISASGAGYLSDVATVRPGFEADVAIFLANRWRIAAQFALTTTDATSLFDADGARGTLITQPFLALLSVSYCATGLTRAELRACGGIAGGAHLESGFVSAPANDPLRVYQLHPSWLVRPTFGLELQLALPIRSFVVGLGFSGLALPVQARWDVSALGSRSLPLFEGLLRLSLAFGGNR